MEPEALAIPLKYRLSALRKKCNRRRSLSEKTCGAHSAMVWILGLFVTLALAFTGYAATAYATNDRVDGVQKQIDTQSRVLEKIDAKLDRLLERGK